MKKKIIAIIGGGASGFMAAISAGMALKENNIDNVDIIIFERMDRVGKKILATGNGRCNISNINSNSKYYHGKNVDFADTILKQFTSKNTISFFEKIGMLCRIEQDGKVYPYSNQASGVLDILRMEAERLGVKEVCNFEVKAIKRQENNFIIVKKSGEQKVVSKIIMSCGGKASSNLGSNGSGYELLTSLGHTMSNIFPALVQIKSSNQFVKALNGIKIDATASILKNTKIIREEKGEILFTEYGLSGILILQLSRIVGEHFLNKNTCSSDIYIYLDIMPDFTKEEITIILEKRVKEQGWKSLENFLTGIFNKRVGQMILKSSGITPLSKLACNLSQNDITNIVKTIKNWEFLIIGTMSWNNAQVTAGGIKVDEFNNNTLESKLVKNLYAVGEILDIDGDCGGFNLQWAWSTGFIAGKSSVETKDRGFL